MCHDHCEDEPLSSHKIPPTSRVRIPFTLRCMIACWIFFTPAATRFAVRIGSGVPGVYPAVWTGWAPAVPAPTMATPRPPWTTEPAGPQPAPTNSANNEYECFYSIHFVFGFAF